MISRYLFVVLCLAFASCNTIVDRSPDFATALTIVALHKAEDRFYSETGRYGSLTELGPEGARLIGRDLASGTSYGHTITLRVTTSKYNSSSSPDPLGSGW
jgi:hypothetical protein